MNIAFLLAVYFIVWWLMLFAVLPFGVVTQGEMGEVVPGTPESAPAHFRLRRVVVITTVAATIVFCALWASVHWGLLDLQATFMDPAQ
jgi:predicted secreted protein